MLDEITKFTSNLSQLSFMDYKKLVDNGDSKGIFYA
jgi:hypothetical protein